MKTVFLMAYVVAGCLVSDAQVPNGRELLKQKKTQREYLVAQIAALKVYLGYLKKGYDIAGKGLNTVGDIKSGTFNLDRDYLNSLKQVSPAVKNSHQVDDILLYDRQIRATLGELYEDCRANENLAPGEVRYIGAVYANMLGQCGSSLDVLKAVITSGETEMNDDERLRRLDGVYLDMEDKYAFAQEFAGGTRALCIERARDKNDIETLKDLNAR